MGRLEWTSPSLFDNAEIAPMFISFLQSQERMQGCFHKSIQRYELPGDGISKATIDSLKAKGISTNLKSKNYLIDRFVYWKCVLD